MKRSAKKALALAVSSVFVPGLFHESTAHAGAPIVATWVTKPVGSWFTASNWFNGVIPNNSGGNQYEALFSTLPTTGSPVTISQSVSVDAIIDNLPNVGQNLTLNSSSGTQTISLFGESYTTQHHQALSNVILAEDAASSSTKGEDFQSGLNFNLMGTQNVIVTSLSTATANGTEVEIDGSIADGVMGQSSALQIDGGGNASTDGGIVYLTGSNSFSGGITVGTTDETEGGTLEINQDGANVSNGTLLGVTSNSTGTGNMVINEQGQLLLNNTSATGYFMNSNQTITLMGIGVNKNISGDIRTSYGTGNKNNQDLILLANIVVGTSDPVTDQGLNGYIIVSATSNENDDLNWAGVVTGTGNTQGIDKQGGGTLEFSNPSNNYTGGMLIGNGAVQVDDGSTMGTGNLQFAQTSSNVADVNLFNTLQQIGSLSSTFLSGSLKNQGSASAYQQELNLEGPDMINGTDVVLTQHTATSFGYDAEAGFCSLTSTINGPGTLTMSASSSPTLMMTGSNTYTYVPGGTLTLNGSNTYSGGTYIFGGTINVANGTGSFQGPSGGQTNQFAVNAGSATGYGDVFVEPGGNLTSGSNAGALGLTMTSGTIAGNLNVSPLGTINPGGVKLIGTLYVQSNVQASGGADFDFDLAGATNATSDFLSVGGNLDTTGTVALNISGSSLALGNYTLVAANALTGGTALFNITSTPTPSSPAVQRSYNIIESGGSVILQIGEAGTDRFWSVGGGNSPVMDGGGQWGSGPAYTNFYSMIGSGTATQVPYSSTSQDDLVIGSGGGGGVITLVTPVEVGGPLAFGTVTTPYTIAGTNVNTLRVDAGIVSTNNTSITAPIVLGASGGTQTFTASVGTTLWISGGISETNGFQTLATADLGTIVLSGSDTYTGGTQVQQGNLQVTTNSLATGGPVSVSSGANLIFGQSTSGIFSGQITGAGQIVIDNTSGAATTLSNASNSYTGSTVLEGGLLAVTSVGDLGPGDGGIYMQGGTLQADAAGLVFPSEGSTDQATVLNFLAGTTSTIDTNGYNVTIGEIPQGSGNLAKIGQGTLTFASIHSTNEIGTLTIAAGAVVFDEQGNPSFGFSGPGIGTNSYQGDLDIDTPTDIRIFGGQLGGGGNINVNVDGSVIEGRDTNGTVTTVITNSINVATGDTLQIYANGSADILKVKTITGGGNVDFASGAAGFTILTGTSTYTGTTKIDYGIGATGDVQLGTNNALPVNTALGLTNSGEFDLSNFNQTVGSLAGSAAAIITNTGTTAGSILTINGSAKTEYDGYIQDGQSESIGLTLASTNTGWLILGGTNVSSGEGTGMSGPLNVIGGRLEVDALGGLGAPSTITVGAEAGNSQIHFNGLVGTLTYSTTTLPSPMAPISPIVLDGMGGYTPPSDTFHPGALNIENSSALVLPSPGYHQQHRFHQLRQQP
jgi:fibronectin-binding autotransporter adhesin